MLGTTAVTIGTNVFRVQNARVMKAGTSRWAVGNLTIASGGVTYGYISATKTRMRQAIWTVPATKTLYITSIMYSASDQISNKTTRFTFRASSDNLTGLVLQVGLFIPYEEVHLNNAVYIREMNPPIKIPATADLKVSAYANSACVASCSLNGWLENN